MKDQYILDQHEGVLCVRADITMSDRPVITSLYWPIGNQYARDWQEFIGHRLDGSGGNYYLSLDETVRPFSWHRQVVFLLTEGVRTEAIHVKSNTVPPPKTRRGIETRWRNGRWEKYLVSKGWVPA